jgi:Fur family peroxide stress response transcriptional regulator
MTRLTHRAVEEMAQAKGLKMTPQRRMIVEYLQSASNHPTADDIVGAINRKFPMASRATVYNTLKWLKDAGMVREVSEAGEVRFDPNVGSHHHFICRSCGRIEDVECDLVGQVQICGLPGRQRVDDVEVTLRGLCDGCQKSDE